MAGVKPAPPWWTASVSYCQASTSMVPSLTTDYTDFLQYSAQRSDNIRVYP